MSIIADLLCMNFGFKLTVTLRFFITLLRFFKKKIQKSIKTFPTSSKNCEGTCDTISITRNDNYLPYDFPADEKLRV